MSERDRDATVLLDRNKPATGFPPLETIIQGENRHYELASLLSSSPLLAVYLATEPSGDKAVVKISLPPDHRVIKEFGMLSNARGMSTVVNAYCAGSQNSWNFMVEEFVPLTWNQFVRERSRAGNRIKEDASFAELLDTLAITLYGLHQRGVIHGKLEPDHLRVRSEHVTWRELTENKKYESKTQSVPQGIALINFTNARIYHPEATEMDTLSPKTWRPHGKEGSIAPEAFNGIICPASDVYGFGRTAVLMLASLFDVHLAAAYSIEDHQPLYKLKGKAFVPTEGLRVLRNAITAGNRDDMARLDKYVFKHYQQYAPLRDILNACLCLDHTKRIGDVKLGEQMRKYKISLL